MDNSDSDSDSEDELVYSDSEDELVYSDSEDELVPADVKVSRKNKAVDHYYEHVKKNIQDYPMDTSLDNKIDRIMSENSPLSNEELRQEALRQEALRQEVLPFFMTKGSWFIDRTFDKNTTLYDAQMCVFICLYLENSLLAGVAPNSYDSVNIGINSQEESSKIILRIIKLLEPTYTNKLIYADYPDNLCALIFWYNWYYDEKNNPRKSYLSIQVPRQERGYEYSGDKDIGDKDSGKSSHYIIDHPFYNIYRYVYQQINIYLSILLQFNASFYKGLNVNSNSVDNYLFKELAERAGFDFERADLDLKISDSKDLQVMEYQSPRLVPPNRVQTYQSMQIENFHILMSEQVETTLYEYVNKEELLMDVSGMVITNRKIIGNITSTLKSSGLINKCIKTAHQNFEFKKIYLLLLLSSEIKKTKFKKEIDDKYGTFFHVYEILQYLYPEIFECFEELDIVTSKYNSYEYIHNILAQYLNIKNWLTNSLSQDGITLNEYETIIRLIVSKTSRQKFIKVGFSTPPKSPTSTTDLHRQISFGGSCRVVESNKEPDLFAAKALIEMGHDFGGPRSEEDTALYEGVSIKNVNGTDLYSKAFRVLDTLADNVVEANVADDSYERQFITDFGLNKPSNEPSFLNLVIETMVKKCPEQVENFYYQPIYEYTFKGKNANPTVYNIFRQKIIEFYPKNEWRVFLKQKKDYDDLYVWVIKKTAKLALNTSLKLHSQDTGLSNYILGACLCEVGFNDAFDALFPDPANLIIDIDKFIPKLAVPTDPARLFETKINTELSKITSGTITHDATGISITGSIQLTGLTKLIDPANSSKPIYGEIIKKNVANVANIEQIYIGYPNTVPIVDPPPPAGGALGAFSQTLFDARIDAEYPPLAHPQINTFLKGLNINAIDSTLAAFNLLLSYWIVPPADLKIVNEYNLVLNNNQIIGIHLSGPLGFTFRLDIEDITVSNICKTMIYWFLNQGQNTKRVIQQMNKVFNHPNCRYKTMADPKPPLIDYKLAIIASFKSFGDECQRKEAEEENRYLNGLATLNIKNNYLLMLSDDRVFVAAGIQHNQPIVSNIKSPHPKFYDIDSMPSNKIPNIGGTITGLLCNKLSTISIPKTTLELLKETQLDITIEFDLIKTKLGVDIQSIADQITLLNDLITLITNNPDYDTTSSAVDKDRDKETLTTNKTTIGKMKSILVCLEYYHGTYNEASKKKQADIYIKYITEQLSSVISLSIDSDTYKNIIAFNTGSNAQQQNINNVDDLTKAIKSMFNKIDFAPKLVACHELACNQAIKKIEMYKAILNTPDTILEDSIVLKITEQYENFIVKIEELRDNYSKKILASLDIYIEEHTSSRQKNKPTIFGVDPRTPEEINQAELTKIQEALAAADIEKNAALAAEAVAAGIAVAPPKGKKGFFDKALKAAKGFFKETTSIYDNLIRDKNDLLEKIKTSALKAAATVHSTDKTEARSFKTWLEGFVNRGGKPKKSRQNKQQHHKKYTKRYKKKTYRKRSQKHLKNKKHKYTKRH